MYNSERTYVRIIQTSEQNSALGRHEYEKSHDVFGKHTVKNIEETYALAKQIASTLKGGEVILLSGDLGAGKTTFTKGLAKALGIDDEVTSPTFTILNVYEDGRLKLNHLDMYRVESADELASSASKIVLTRKASRSSNGINLSILTAK